MSQPEWMQKFKQIGLKSPDAVETGDQATSRFEKFDTKQSSVANSNIPPWLQGKTLRSSIVAPPPIKRPDAETPTSDDDDAAALFAAAGSQPAKVAPAEEEEKKPAAEEEDAAALFAAAGSQPAVIQKEEQEDEKPPAPSSGLSAEEEEIADRFRKMLKMGMPEGAVVQKMLVEEVPPHVQDAVLQPPAAAPAPAPAPGPVGLSADEEELADRFRKMMKMGMPEGAVIQKMTAEGVPSHVQDAVLQPAPTPPEETTTTTSSTTEEAPVPPEPQDAQSVEEEIIMEEEVVEESLVEDSSTATEKVENKPAATGAATSAQRGPSNEQKMSDEEFGERWVVDKHKLLHELSTTRFEEVEVGRDTGNVHYDEIYIDENGNEVVIQRTGARGLVSDDEQEVLVDEDGNTIDEEILVDDEYEDELEDEPQPSMAALPVESQEVLQSQGAELPPSEPPLEPVPEPPHDPAFDIENQRKLLQRGSKAYRSQMAGWVPYVFVFAIIAASVLVLFFVVLAEDDGIEPQGIPTAAPTPRNFLPLTPTNTGAIDVAATTPLEPVSGSCNFRGVDQPHVIDQCACDGKITIIADDILQRYNSLLENFMPDVIPNFNEDVDSCDPSNQALIWLSSGINNAGEAEEFVRQDRYALAFFFLDQGGIGWSESAGWLSEQNACLWDHISCDSEGRVVGLDVSNNGIIGQLSTAIGVMANLESFSAAQNNIEGTIPPEIFGASKLTSLDLSSNSILGIVPPFPEDLMLKSIDLSSNELSGAIDSSIGNLESLEVLNLTSNAFNSSLPSELFGLPLLELYLGSNFLSGSIPSGIADLSSLMVLDLGPNDFTGDIPTGISNLTNLTSLVIQEVPQLTGRLPASYGLMLTNLREFVLKETDVRGNIPEQFGLMTALEILNLGRNTLGRALPTELGLMTNLKSLILDNNAFTGTLPEELGNAIELREIQLQINQLVGTIPSSIGRMTKLSSLRLDGNFLEGRAPDEVCALRQDRLDEFTVDCPQRVTDVLVIGVICSVPSCCTECF